MLGVYPRIRESPSHWFQLELPRVQIYPNSLETAIGMIMKRSIYKNLKKAYSVGSQVISGENTWKSPKDDAKEYRRVTVVNWIMEYSALEKISASSQKRIKSPITCI